MCAWVGGCVVVGGWVDGVGHGWVGGRAGEVGQDCQKGDSKAQQSDKTGWFRQAREGERKITGLGKTILQVQRERHRQTSQGPGCISNLQLGWEVAFCMQLSWKASSSHGCAFACVFVHVQDMKMQHLDMVGGLPFTWLCLMCLQSIRYTLDMDALGTNGHTTVEMGLVISAPSTDRLNENEFASARMVSPLTVRRVSPLTLK